MAKSTAPTAAARTAGISSSIAVANAPAPSPKKRCSGEASDASGWPEGGGEAEEAADDEEEDEEDEDGDCGLASSDMVGKSSYSGKSQR